MLPWPFLKSAKRKCQRLESILQHGRPYSIWEAFSLLCGKGRLCFFPRATCGRGKRWQHRRVEGHVPPLQPRRNPFKSTDKGSRDMTTKSEESYVTWGFQAQPWARCLVPACLGMGKPGGAEWSHRVQKTSAELQRLEVCAVSVAVRLCRDLPQVFSSSSTPSGFLSFFVQDTFGLWLLISQWYSLVLMALLPLPKAFCCCVLEKMGAHSFHILLKSILHLGRGRELGEQHLFRACHTFTFQ